MNETANNSIRDQAEALLALVESIKPEPEPFYVNEFVRRLLAHFGKIPASIWCVEDMQGIRSDLTPEQAWEVLEEVGRRHDAEYGVSWITLECMADELFPKPTKRRRRP